MAPAVAASQQPQRPPLGCSLRVVRLASCLMRRALRLLSCVRLDSGARLAPRFVLVSLPSRSHRPCLCVAGMAFATPRRALASAPLATMGSTALDPARLVPLQAFHAAGTERATSRPECASASLATGARTVAARARVAQRRPAATTGYAARKATAHAMGPRLAAAVPFRALAAFRIHAAGMACAPVLRGRVLAFHPRRGAFGGDMTAQSAVGCTAAPTVLSTATPALGLSRGGTACAARVTAEQVATFSVRWGSAATSVAAMARALARVAATAFWRTAAASVTTSAPRVTGTAPYSYARPTTLCIRNATR